MATHRVLITDPALENLAELSEYIAQDSPADAARVSEEIIANCRSLADLPWKFKQVGVSRRTKFPVHWMIVSPYIVYYRIEPKTVQILMIRHGRRRQPKRFE